MDDFLSTIAKLTGNKSLVSEPKIDVNPILDRMRDSVVTQESGGRQKIKNPRTGATGLFQVLPSNIPNWTKKYLGKSLTPEQYANDPDAQEKVFRGEMGRYLEKALRTSPDEDTAIRKAAAAWYGGEGAMHRYDDPKRFRPDEPSFQEYTNSILGRLKQKPQTDTPDFLSSLQDLTKDLGGEDFLSRIQKIAPSPTNPVNPPKVNIPAPEAPETINAQIQSTLDPNSPKKGTLLTPGEQIPTLGGLQVIDVPEGKLAVNPAKGQPQSLAEAIGKVQDVGSNTRGMTVLTTDAQGNELSASIVRDPKAAAEQVKLDKQMYPQAVNHELLPSEEVARRRAEITRNPFQSPDARQFPWSMMLPNEMPETQESIRNKREWEKWGPVYRQFLVDEKLEDSPEALKRFNTKMQALSATQREKTRKVARKSNLDAQVGSEEKTYKFDETGVLALENGKKLFVDNSKEVPVDTTRFRDDEGETYLFDRTTGKLQDESLSDIADTFPVSRVPYTQKATTPLRQAQEHRAVQVARALATKYGMNEDDVYQWVMQRGFTDPEASKAQGRDVPLPEDRYYESDAQGLIRNQTNYNRQGSSIGAPGTKPPTGEISSSDTHSLTRRQMRELEAFTSEQKAKREQAVLKMISEGREPDAKTLRSLGVSLDELRSKQYDEFEMARVKGRVNQADIDRFKAEYRSQGNDERLAELKALQRKGIGGKKVSTEIANYENRRREIAEEVRKYGGLFKEGGYAEKKYGYAPQTQTPEDIDRKVNAQIAKEIQAYGSITAFVNKQKKAEAEERARIERIKNDPTSKKVFEYVKGYSAGVAGSAVEGIGDLVKGFPIWTKPVADYIDSLFGTNHRDLKNHPFTQLGQGIKDAGQFIKDWQSRDYQKEFWAGSIPQNLGSSIAFTPAAAGGPLGISLFATMQMTGSSYDEAIEAGAKPETAEKYGQLVGGLLGWTERFGLGESWQRLIKGQGGKRIKGILLDALKESAEEVFVNELPQSLGQNYLAKLTFDPARQWDKDLADNLGAAGVSAPVASILISGLLHIKHRRQIAQVVKDDMVNGGPLVRDFGEWGVFVSGKQIQVTKELEPLLQKHQKYQKEIQTGFDDIKEAKKRKEAAKFNDKPRYDRIIDDIRREQFRVMLEQQKVAGAIARLSGSVPSIVEQKESAEKQTQTQRVTLKPLNETKAPTPQKPAPVDTKALVQDQPPSGDAPVVSSAPVPAPKARTGTNASGSTWTEIVKTKDDGTTKITYDTIRADGRKVTIGRRQFAKDEFLQEFPLLPEYREDFEEFVEKYGDEILVREIREAADGRGGITLTVGGKEKGIHLDLELAFDRNQKPSAPTNGQSKKPTVDTKALAKDTPVESKAEPKSVESLLKYYEEAPTDLIPEAPLRPSTLEGAKNRIKEVEEQRDIARREAETSPLSGLPNKRAFDKALPQAEKDPNTSVVFFDLDQFKAYNDAEGQQKGDALLKKVADAVNKAKDEVGVARENFHFGGDEFAALPPTDKAEQFLKRAQEIFGEVRVGDKVVSLTGGIGQTFREAEKNGKEAKKARKIEIGKREGLTVTDREGNILYQPEESKKANPVAKVSQDVTTQDIFDGNKDVGDITSKGERVLGNFSKLREAKARANETNGKVVPYLEGKYKTGWYVVEPAQAQPVSQKVTTKESVAPKKKTPSHVQQAAEELHRKLRGEEAQGLREFDNAVFDEQVRKGLGDASPNYIYYTKDARTIPAKHGPMGQTEKLPITKVKLVFSESPLPQDFQTEWELAPIEIRPTGQQKASRKEIQDAIRLASSDPSINTEKKLKWLRTFAENNPDSPHLDKYKNVVKHIDEVQKALYDVPDSDLSQKTGTPQNVGQKVTTKEEGGNIPSQDKQPWEMSREEFAKTATVKRQQPEVPFEQWAKENGYPEQVADETDKRHPNGISNKALKDKQNRLDNNLALRMEAREKYNALVESGKIKTVTRESTANTDNESDLASTRIQHKRAVKQALSEGKPVPAEVLADYPDLAPKKSAKQRMAEKATQESAKVQAESKPKTETQPKGFEATYGIPASLEMPSYLPVNARTDYEDAITDYFEGTLTDPIFVSNTNRILTKLKMPSLPILVTPKVLDKAIQGKHSDEGITADTLLKMRGDIDQPLAVLKSNNEDAPEGSLLLVLPTKTIKDTYLTVAIHPNQKIGRVEVNRIATIHARDLSKSVRSWQHQKLFRYVGGGLSRELTTTYGSNFAPVVQSILDSDPNIITESNDVNTLEMPSPKEWHKDIITDKGINYDKVNRIAEQVISGESQIVRLDDKGERGRVLGGIRNVEASLILAANERSSEDAGSRTPPVKRQEQVESASLEMPADSGSFKLQEDAQFAHPQDLLDRAKSSITDDGHIELNVEAGELLRRIAGKPNAFFGLTHTRGTLIQLSRKIDQKLDEFRKVGYSDAEIKVLTDLADQLREVAKKGAGITYIFDFSLPHETHHQMVLNALNGETIPKETIDELSKLKVWNNPKIKTVTGQVTTFSRLYPRASGVTKAMEIAAMLDTGEITHADKNEFLKIFARGIKSVSTVNPDDYIRIFQYDSQTSDTGRSEAVGSEPETSGSTSEDRQASPTKEEANQEAGTRPGDGQVQRPDSGTEVSVENKAVRQLTDYDRLFKKRKYAETLRENGYEDAPDVPYIPDTEKKWLEDAQRRISASKHDDYKTAEKAFYEDNMEPQQRTALGIGLLDHLGSIGELERMIKVSEELVKHVGTAAQALRASQLAGKYDFVTGMMIATRAVKKAGKELTAKDAEKVRELLTRIAQTEEEKASLTYLNQELETAVKEADKNIKELEGALNEAQAERKVDEKTIARLKRQIATLKENRPRTYHAKQKAELERVKPDLEKILREAFSLAMNAPDTDAFRSWFGDSKVVDENGKPLVVYHGTPTGGFTEFDAGQSGRAGDPGIRGKGFYFSNNEGLADMYQTRPNHGRTGIPQTYPVYLSIRNPYDGNKDVLGLLGRGTDTSEIRRKIESSGYDGVIYILPDGKNIEFVAFNPNQIKSAIGNKGTFDPNNPSILEMPADDRIHNALVDMASLDILNYVSPEDTIEHLRDLTNNMLSEDELREIHLEAFEATKTESNITPEARKNSAIRMAHRRMAMQTAKPDVQKVRERPSRYDKEVITFGRNNGYTDKEILGAILFPKIKGAHSVSEWKKLVDGDDNTFKRSRELRQKVNNDIQDQIIKAKADREGYKGDLEKFKNEVIHNGIAGREARKAFDSYARKLGRSLGRKAFDLASETVSLFKGLSAWGEISYIGRQGFIPLLTDTRAAIKGDWKGVGHGLQGDNELWKFLADKAGFENAAEYLSNHSLSVFVEQIRQHPRFLSAQNNGVRFTQIGDFNVADDHFSTQLLEKVPFYRRAEVAYTLPGDLQRLYIYDNWATMLEQQNLSADEMKKALKYVAETVNAFTGKGDIGKVIAKGGALSKALNLALFSPQLLFSRFQSLNKLTLGWATAPKGLKIQMAKKGLRFYGILAVIAALTGMVLDPEDEDFGKINIGDTHADLLAGLDVPAQLYMRTAMGFVKSVINQDTAYLADDIQANIREFGVSKEGQPRFVRSKLSPGASLAVDAYTGTDFIGRPFTWWGGLTSRSVPLAWQQTYDALLYDRYREMVKEPRTFEYAVNKFNENERNYLNALMVMAGTFTGIGITQYPKADRSKAVQLAAQLSPFVSKKDAEQRRIEGGLRSLLADKFDLLKQNKDTRKVDAEIERWMRINPDLNKKFSAINTQAGSKYGLLSLYLKDLNADQLRRVKSVATDPGEIKIIDKRIKTLEK